MMNYEVGSRWQWIENELYGLYGKRVTREMAEIVRLYGWYDGSAQRWEMPAGLEYRPAQCLTNLIRKLIKEESRFMMSRAPELRIIPENAKDADAATETQKWLNRFLQDIHWRGKLIKAARDCFIGKRVALKLGGKRGGPLTLDFHSSLEFVYDVDPDDASRLTSVIFFYQMTDDVTDKGKQRVWRQKYWLENGCCLMSEAEYDGYGKVVRTIHDSEKTGLSFIPAYVIVNDSLTGDLSGESDVEALISNQDLYNHLKSDDADALKFNMFPQRVFTDASQESMDHVLVAPAALIDLQTAAESSGRQAKAEMLESGFGYSERLEAAMDRIKTDMHDLIGVPNATLDQLKGALASGKSMRALYWTLLCRCEEKWAEWDDALIWMVERLLDMARIYNISQIPEIPHTVRIEHLYPIPDDELEERQADLAEVAQSARSRRSYISKWQPDEDATGELEQIAREKKLEQDSFDLYTGAIRSETGG